ncbi:MAG: hypothetical protein SV375_02915 [Thermodesulfobacteriota bacterium]|nr:hypothetical protein [Thermodesulfobacteriota bacterium]
MIDLKKLKRIMMVVLIVFTMGLFFMGCATSKQLMAVEDMARQALEKSDAALKEAENARSMVSEESKKAEAAALRAEKAAERSVQAAEEAESSADRAESIFMQKMKK